ncbi:hypothetical protein DVW83_13600 [Enterococcus sp. VV15]|nr:hypothetical protein DVW83_13600 [Enterococcus sp. VV15]
MWLKTLYRKRAVTWPFIFYTIIWTLSYLTIFYIEKKQRNFIFIFTFLIILLVLFSNYLLERNTGVISYIDQLSSYCLSIWREILKYKDPLLFSLVIIYNHTNNIKL